MKAIANSILATILVSIFIITFTNFIMLFPWYLTLVFETMNLSSDVATVNGVTKNMVDNVILDLEDKPLFKRKMSDLKIFISHSDSDNDVEVQKAVFSDDKEVKHRRQRGKKIKVGIEAVFPFDIKVFGNTYSYQIPIRFNLSTIGVRYYKDLEGDPFSLQGSNTQQGATQ
ncbi:hypothetical protein [Pseudobacteroides cellulosolvens]|uniref:Uncharacterized protein n=1 Tax=Pseudobacteroides cellulosolvens ATCC 35603 = DSM 2933 TaxID=398512 RepID=A0A0L6JQ70_9FIRM|nr:hypothetical protein [Pseudobacteroides cellulosolvens]KNY27517.1 hypothetical protein Bccel_2788 [Pseudobacteroides cellulosolvens ATCC 35603 = DSM 2933]